MSYVIGVYHNRDKNEKFRLELTEGLRPRFKLYKYDFHNQKYIQVNSTYVGKMIKILVRENGL